MLAAELHTEDLVCTVLLKGSLDALTVHELQRAVELILGGTAERLVFDMSGLDFIDSSGVGAVVAAFKRARGQRKELEVQSLGGQPKEIFRLLRLDRVLAGRSHAGPQEPAS